MSNIQEKIKAEQERIRQEQLVLIRRITERYWVNVLFEFSTVLEEYYVQTAGDLSALQQGVDGLGRLLLRIWQEKEWGKDERALEKILEKWIQRIVQQVYKGRTNLVFAQLFDLELKLNNLAVFADIDKDDSDRSQEVEYKDGQFEIVSNRQDLLQIEQKTAAKYRYEVNFYLNFGRQCVPIHCKQTGIVLRGESDMDANASFEIMAWQFATRLYLEHYGIEESFPYGSETYQREVLVEILAFLREYYQSRYGFTFAKNLEDGLIALPAIAQSIEDIARAKGMYMGPLVIWEEKVMVKKLAETLKRHPKKILAEHLTFFTATLASESSKNLNILHTPLQAKDGKITIFLRPLMGQNTWLPLAQRLVGEDNDGLEQARTTRATERLGEMLREQLFTVVTEEKLLKTNGEEYTDIDIGAFKDGHLFLFELKMTAPKERASDYLPHLENKLKKRGRKQLKRVATFLSENWPSFRYMFATDQPWEEVEKHLILLSPSFEWDRHPKFHPATKISMFELERYLRNDASFMFDENKENPVLELQNGFCPVNEQLTGQRLWELIEGDTLWHFLDEQAQTSTSEL